MAQYKKLIGYMFLIFSILFMSGCEIDGYLTADREQIHAGESVILTWDLEEHSGKAQSAYMEPGIGERPINGSIEVSPLKTTTYSITWTGKPALNGEVETATDSIVIKVLPSIDISASPSSIEYGSSSKISWSTINADTCTLEPGYGSVKTSDSLSVSPKQATTYTLTATGPEGSTSESVAINVLPSVSLMAKPFIVRSGNPVTLTWDTEYADSCTLEPGPGIVGDNGAVTFRPEETTTYTLKASNTGGSTVRQVQVKVYDPPDVRLSVSEKTISAGDPVILTWSAENASKVWINNGIGQVDEVDEVEVRPDYTTTYKITATNVYGSVSASSSVKVLGSLPLPQPEGSFGEAYNDLVPDDASLELYDAKRFIVITGLVTDSYGAPIDGVTIELLHKPQYGTAFTDDNGRYSIPAEGGGSLTVAYRKDGYITSHRKVETLWNDIVTSDTVVMIPVDTEPTIVNFNGDSNTVITHYGAKTEDPEFGNRSCTIVFSGDNKAYSLDDQGNVIEELTSITTRATEFTTKESMPAVLPTTSAYTYCAEFSVDGIERIRFDKPVVSYVDNFLGFDVGSAVPLGYYNRQKGEWEAADNGVVVRLLDTDDNGITDALDADGDNNPDDLNRDGSFLDEVKGLGDKERYQPGSTFWRFEVSHFTPWDCNWPFGPPDNAIPPNPASEPNPDEIKEECNDCDDEISSYVSARSRVFHEDIPIPGTEFNLHYASNRVQGYKHVIKVPASGDSVPDSLNRIVVFLDIAGRSMMEVLPAEPNQQVAFTWDGLDYRGNRVNGSINAYVRIGFVYPAVYLQPANFEKAFSIPGGSATGSRARQDIIFWKRSKISLHNASGTIAEGWTISPQHTMNPSDPDMISKGDGNVARNDNSKTVQTIANLGTSVWSVAVGPAGDVYASTRTMVYRIEDNTSNVVAGNGQSGYSGDGGPAVDAKLNNVNKITVDGAGNIYIADQNNYRVRKVDTDGIITTIAGVGVSGHTGDGGPATQAKLISPKSVAVGPSGALYILDGFGGSQKTFIRRVDPNGIITTIAGEGDKRDDGFQALESEFNNPQNITVDNNGNIYMSDYYEGSCGWVAWAYIRKIDSSGNIATVAGGGCHSPNSLGTVSGIAVDSKGTLYVAHHYAYDYNYNWGTYNHFTTKIGPEGNNILVAGKPRPADNIYKDVGFSGDGGPATQAMFNHPNDVAVDSTGTVYIADSRNNRVRMVGPPRSFAGEMNAGDIHFSEENGVGHIFSSEGAHRKTIDLDTGTVLYEFGYDDEGNLTSIFDRFGRETTIEISGDTPSAIVSPGGFRVNLSIDSDRLDQVIYEDESYYKFEYTSDGLMDVEHEPNLNRFWHAFDDNGRLTDVYDEAGGHWNYTKTEPSLSETLTTTTTGEGNVTSYLDRTNAYGSYKSIITGPSRDETVYNRSADSLRVTKSLPCGLGLVFDYGLDDEYKYRYVRNITETTPSGLVRVTSKERAYEDTDDDNKPDLITDTVTVNDMPSTIEHNVPAHQYTVKSPENRAVIYSYEAGTLLTTGIALPGLNEVTYEYFPEESIHRGKLKLVRSGTRETKYTYYDNGLLKAIEDPEQKLTEFEAYDQVGRVTRVRRPDTTSVKFDYDSNGNMTVLTNPSEKSHGFGYNKVNLRGNYTTPLIRGYSYKYDKDRRIKSKTFPSLREIYYDYKDPDTGDNSKLMRILTPEGNIGFTYRCGSQVGTISKGTELITYDYDGKLLKSEVYEGLLNESILYRYDSDGDFDLDGLTYAGVTEELEYDSDRLLTGSGDFTINRRVDNGLPDVVAGGTLTLDRTFNGYGETESETFTVNGRGIATWGVVNRDNNGRITEKTETVNSEINTYVYGYDDNGRLEIVTKNGVLTEEYNYNDDPPYGTCTKVTNTLQGISNASLRYDDEDRMYQFGDTFYNYDEDGFLASRVNGNDETLYDYSSRGELLGVSLSEGIRIDYLHDPLGRRIAKKVNGTIVEKYLWQGITRLLGVYDGADNLLMRFEYADSRMPVAMTKGGLRYYLVYDQVGSLRAVSDANGNVVKSIEYDSFGKIYHDSDETFRVPFGFAGGLHDQDTGLVRFGYRDYDPEIRRWTAKDPILFAGGDTDLYGYVLNDPINFVDPLGLFNQKAFVRGLALTGSGLVGVIAGAGMSSSGVGAILGVPTLFAGIGTFSGGIIQTIVAAIEEPCEDHSIPPGSLTGAVTLAATGDMNRAYINDALVDTGLGALSLTASLMVSDSVVVNMTRAQAVNYVTKASLGTATGAISPAVNINAANQ